MKTQTENRATFVARLEGKFSKNEIDEIMFAYDLSKEAHRTHKRDSGERYFEHPRAGVLIILDELKWSDKNAIIAFLLHDTGEDSPILGNVGKDYEEFVKSATLRLTKMFSREVAELVIGLTKPKVDGKRFMTKEETGKHYLTGLKENSKITLLKMVDRLHNLRSLKGTTPEKRAKTLIETETVYIPLFHNLFMSPYEAYGKKLVPLFTEAMDKRGQVKVPGVGEKIYVPTRLYLGHGIDDFEGGIATVIKVTPEVYGGKLVHYISTKEQGPSIQSRWEGHLCDIQEKLKKEFGDRVAYPDPDYREEFNRWD